MSTQSNNNKKYTNVAIFLHWVTAILVISLFLLGWYMVELPKSPVRGPYFSTHKSLGLTVLLLVIFRVYWRFKHTPPAFPAAMDAWRKTLANITHKLFYVALFVQPISGYLSSSFTGRKTTYFNVIPLPQWASKNPPLNEFFTEIHVACSVFLLCLIIAHLLGAFSHLFTKGDETFKRMLPSCKSSSHDTKE